MNKIKNLIVLAIALIAGFRASAQDEITWQLLLGDHLHWYTFNKDQDNDKKIRYISGTTYPQEEVTEDFRCYKYTEIYDFDRVDGRLNAITTMDYFRPYDVPQIHCRSYHYDIRGRLKTYDFDGYQIVYEYDDLGRVIETSNIAPHNRECIRNWSFTYGDDGILNSISSLSYGKNIGQYSIERSADGNTLTLNLKEEGMPRQIYTFKFDGKKWLLVKDKFNNLVKTYNDDGNLVKTTDGDMTTTFTYNTNGDCVKMTATDSTGNVTDITEYEYEYDPKGNWTKKWTIANGNRKLTKERIINY